jgi:hypothetical protein
MDIVTIIISGIIGIVGGFGLQNHRKKQYFKFNKMQKKKLLHFERCKIEAENIRKI